MITQNINTQPKKHFGVGVKFFVDAVMLIVFIITSVSIFMGRGAREIHEVSGKIFIVVVIIHFILNWKIFVTMGKNLFKKNEINQNNTEIK